MKIPNELYYLDKVLESGSYKELSAKLDVNYCYVYNYAKRRGINKLITNYFMWKREHRYNIAFDDTRKIFVVNDAVYKPLRDYYKSKLCQD